MTSSLILLVFSLVCFLFSAWQHTSPQWNRVISIGFAALVASMFVGR